MCVLSPPTHTHIHISTCTHSLVRLRRPATRSHRIPPSATHARERTGEISHSLGVFVFFFFLLFPPKTSGSPPPRKKSTRKMGARNQPPRRPAPNTPREINYRTESAQNLQHECRCGTYPSLARRATAPAGDGSLGLGTGVGG